MNTLPEDVFYTIILMFPCHRVFSQLSQVNKRICKIMDSERVWKQYLTLVYKYESEKKFGVLFTPIRIESISGNFKSVVSEFRAELDSCVMSFDFLKVIDLRNCTHYNYYFISDEEYILIECLLYCPELKLSDSEKRSDTKTPIQRVKTTIRCIQTHSYETNIKTHSLVIFDYANRLTTNLLRKSNNLIYTTDSIEKLSKIIACVILDHYKHITMDDEQLPSIVRKTSIKRVIQECKEQSQHTTSQIDPSCPSTLTPQEICLKLERLH